MAAVTPGEAIRIEESRDHALHSGHWIQSPLWDAFWMFSAIWGCALLFTLDSTIGWKRASIILFFGNGLLALYHSWSTTFMVLGSGSMREVRATDPVRYRWIPLAIVVASFAVGIGTGASLSFPASGQFGLELWPWILYLSLFWVGHFWHFGRQDFGVLSLYRSRAGQNAPRDRQIDERYCRVMMYAIQPIVYLSVLTKSPFGQAFYNVIPIPHDWVRTGATGAIALAGALTLAVVWIEISRSDRSLPKLAYYAIMLAHPLILYFAGLGLAFYYLIAYFWSHWFIAVGLVSRINSGYYRARGLGRFTAGMRHFLTIGAIAAVIMLGRQDYEQFRVFSGRDYKQVLASVTLEQGWIVGAFLGFFLAEQLLHYYCDRNLFRMRNPAVRKAIGPYL